MPSQTSVTAFLMAERGTKKGKTTLFLKNNDAKSNL
jgi:hypothetical protein